MPTRSPSLTWPASAPTAITWPTPSWPGMNGGRGFTGQSPSAACKSVWQTPQASILTSTSWAPGRGTSTSSIASGLPNPCTTAAFIVLSIDASCGLDQYCQRKLSPPLSTEPLYGLRAPPLQRGVRQPARGAASSTRESRCKERQSGSPEPQNQEIKDWFASYLCAEAAGPRGPRKQRSVMQSRSWIPHSATPIV